LNSSFPKAKLFAKDPMISADCRKCEAWIEKDLVYAIGVTKNKKLNLLWLIYGDCYAASQEYYTRIKNTIATGISTIEAQVLNLETKLVLLTGGANADIFVLQSQFGLDTITDFNWQENRLQLATDFTGSLGLSERAGNTTISIIDGQDETAIAILQRLTDVTLEDLGLGTK
jgi:hypothetical protein